jgi:hypothetical protein
MSTEGVFFSHNKSANSIFQPDLSAKRTDKLSSPRFRFSFFSFNFYSEQAACEYDFSKFQVQLLTFVLLLIMNHFLKLLLVVPFR